MKLKSMGKRKIENKDSWIIRYRWYLLAFLIPVVTAATAFICQGVWPFGTRGISIIDSYHQYVPFFSELQYKWRNFDSLFYTWNGGLGTNFMSIFAYYLASPLNLLLLAVPKSFIMETFAMIYLIKVGLCGVTFYVYLNRKMGKDGLAAVAFAVAYALSGYVIGYGWNIMWLDCIVLFPILLLGLERLVHRGNGLVYGLALALCIYSNYYISIMICIFLCLYFVAEMLRIQGKTWKKCLSRIGKFTGYSLLGGAFGAVMLLPALSTLLATKSAETSFPTSLKFYTDAAELFTQHFAAVAPTSLTGNPNLYCGVFVLILIPLYWMNKKIALKDKIIYTALTGFVLLSLNVNILAYVWQGFHFPNGLPGRFSFIYIFLIIRFAYEGFIYRKGWPDRLYIFAVLPAAGLLICTYVTKAVDFEWYVWLINGGLILLYILLISAVKCGRTKKKAAWIGLVALFFVEICGNSVYGLCENGTVNREGYYSDQKTVQKIKKTVEKADNSFFRMEVEERRGRDDVTWHNLPGMSLFSSTVNAGTDNLMRRLGFFAVTNKYSYEGATPETDAILNIKYLISNVHRDDLRTFEWLDKVDDKNLYQNYSALGLGFVVSDAISEWNYEQTNPFSVLNNFAQSAAGEASPLYDSFGIGEPEADSCDVTKDTWADFSYTKTADDGTLTWTYVPETDEDLYAYFKAIHCEKLTVNVNGESKSYSDEDGHIVQVGNIEAGQQVTFTFYLDDEYENGTIKFIGGRHHMDVFYRMVDKLKQRTFESVYFKSDLVVGNVKAGEGGVLFTSIPYEKGWSIEVDGVKTEPVEIGGGLIGIPLLSEEHSQPLQDGKHVIVMSYKSPGYSLGIVFTLGAGLLFLGLIRRNKLGKNYKLLRKCKM